MGSIKNGKVTVDGVDSWTVTNAAFVHSSGSPIFVDFLQWTEEKMACLWETELLEHSAYTYQSSKLLVSLSLKYV